MEIENIYDILSEINCWYFKLSTAKDAEERRAAHRNVNSAERKLKKIIKENLTLTPKLGIKEMIHLVVSNLNTLREREGCVHPRTISLTHDALRRTIIDYVDSMLHGILWVDYDRLTANYEEIVKRCKDRIQEPEEDKQDSSP